MHLLEGEYEHSPFGPNRTLSSGLSSTMSRNARASPLPNLAMDARTHSASGRQHLGMAARFDSKVRGGDDENDVMMKTMMMICG